MLNKSSKRTSRYSTVPIYTLKVVKERNLKYPVGKVSYDGPAAMVMRAYLQNCACENLAILLLDGNNEMIGIATITIGGLSHMKCSVRDVLTHAIAGRAHSFILGHNHPSGNVTPSEDDIEFTKCVVEAGKMIGCPCVDHIIVSSGVNEGHFSFLVKGIIQ